MFSLNWEETFFDFGIKKTKVKSLGKLDQIIKDGAGLRLRKRESKRLRQLNGRTGPLITRKTN